MGKITEEKISLAQTSAKNASTWRRNMRVIAGTRRSIRLKTIKGDDVRPTTDRIKETLFNMLNPYLADCTFLDLFSGSGAIGIEALSRGASQAVLVEQDREALACLKDNLKITRFTKEARLLESDVFFALKRLEAEGKPFDLIFMDPPYNKELEKRVLETLANSCLADEDTMIIVEASAQTSFSYVEALGFYIQKEKSYGSNKHIFIKKHEK